MLFAPDAAVAQVLPQEGVRVAANGFPLVRAKFIELSPENEVELNAGVPVVETVTCAPLVVPYHEHAVGSVVGEVASEAATKVFTDEVVPESAYEAPLYKSELPWVRLTEPETPWRCHAHCGTVPTLEPVEFDPEISADAGEKLERLITRPTTANAREAPAVARFNEADFMVNPFSSGCTNCETESSCAVKMASLGASAR